MSASSEAVVVTLPLPPSTNALWANRSGGGKRLSKTYEKWLFDAGWLLKTQRPRTILGAVAVKVEASRPNRKRDLDNLLKALLDLLVRHQVISDDRYVEAISARWVSRDIPGVRVTISKVE